MFSCVGTLNLHREITFLLKKERITLLFQKKVQEFLQMTIRDIKQEFSYEKYTVYIF